MQIRTHSRKNEPKQQAPNINPLQQTYTEGKKNTIIHLTKFMRSQNDLHPGL